MNHDLWALARQGILRRRRSSLLLFLVLLLSFAFAVMMLSVMGSMDRTNTELLKNTYGGWYGAIPDGKAEDRPFLEQREWLDQLGESVNYAKVSVTLPVSGAGTVDESFVEMGRIRLKSGRLPEAPGEVAVEADLLEALGYDQTIGQSIILPLSVSLADDPDYYIRLDREFVLSGVLEEYAHVWILEKNAQNRLLNSAIFLPEDGEAVIAEAQSRATSYGLDEVRPPVTSYFYTPMEGMEETLRDEVDGHLAATRGIEEDFSGCINLSAGTAYLLADYNTFYVGLILVITLLAVVAVYLLALQSDVRRIVRLRSLGASKMQLRRLLLLETVLLAVPAVALGTALGAAGTAGLLRLLVFSGSVAVVVAIPWVAVAVTVLLWVLGVATMRMLTFQAAVRTPMTGRMSLETKQRRRVAKLQRGFAWGLTMALCLVTTYSVLKYQKPLELYTYYSGTFSYSLSRVSTTAASEETPLVITPEETAPFLEIPGITGCLGLTQLDGTIAGDTVEAQAASVYVVDAGQWMERGGLPAFDEVDLEAYRRGETAVLLVLSQPDGTVTVTTHEEEKGEDGETVYTAVNTAAEVTAAAGDTIALSVEAIVREENESEASYHREALSLPLEVGTVARLQIDAQDNQNFGLPVGFERLYTVLVSPGYVQRALDTLPEGSQMGPYRTDDPFGCQQVLLFTDLTAEYLSTDNAVSQLAFNQHLSMGSIRMFNVPVVQTNFQTMLTLAASGLCIGLIAALLLLSTLELEAQRERRRYGILRALGMSRRQQNLALARQAALQAVTAIVAGCGIYVAISVRDTILNYQKTGSLLPPLAEVIAYHLGQLRYTWFVPLLLLGEFLLVVGLYLAAKGGLYKLNLMEMLSQER